MIGPVRGTVKKIFYYSFDEEKLAVVHKDVGGDLFVILYTEKETGWKMIDELQMGFLVHFHDEFEAFYGEIVDLGLSVSQGEGSLLVLETTDHGKRYAVYEVNREVFGR
jgi:hypothetical protein